MSTNTAINEIRSSGFFSEGLALTDPAVAAAIAKEVRREKKQIELIASENIVSKAVLEAQGSVFTNKYAEGYPGKRYYQGCEPSDDVERLAIERACKLFDCAYANVQPHSGAQANGAVLLALIKPGDTILGMSLDAGGHLTHGARAAMSGKWFNAVQYGVTPDTHLIDYDEVRRLALEHKPKLIFAGARPIRGTSISPSSARSPTKWARSSRSTWRTLPASSQQACTPRPSRMRMSPPRRPTRRCAVRAVA